MPILKIPLLLTLIFTSQSIWAVLCINVYDPPYFNSLGLSQQSYPNCNYNGGYALFSMTEIANLSAPVTALQTQVATLQSEKTALQTQVATLQSSSTPLQNQVATLQSEKTALQNQIATLQSEKTALQIQLTALQTQTNNQCPTTNTSSLNQQSLICPSIWSFSGSYEDARQLGNTILGLFAIVFIIISVKKFFL
jgi:cell division protein FtsB